MQKNYSLSDRQLLAVRAMGKKPIDVIRDGLWILTKKPEVMTTENIGIDEKPKVVGLDFGEADLEIVDNLKSILGINSASAVIRNAVDVLIEERNLTQFKKPAGWKSRPPTINSFGSRGKNPKKILPYRPKNKSLSFPLWLWRKMPSINVSEFARVAIDSCEPDSLIPLTSEELTDDKFHHTVALYEQQHGRLTELVSQYPQFKTEGQILLAILRQSAERG